MMDVPLSLRAELTYEDVEKLCAWTADPAVVRYLNEEAGTADSLRSLLGRPELPVLSPLFSRGGRFYMLDRGRASVGFVRFAGGFGPEAELVVVIGERSLWGKGLGTMAVSLCLRKLFFELRAERVTALIHPFNARSIGAFEANGFRQSLVKSSFPRYELTLEQYLLRSRRRA